MRNFAGGTVESQKNRKILSEDLKNTNEGTLDS